MVSLLTAENYLRESEEALYVHNMVHGPSVRSLLLETHLITESLTGPDFYTVMENTKKDGKKSIAGFVKRVIKFIKDMLARFKDKLQTTFQPTTKWLEERKDDFKSIVYDGLEMEVVPYWKGNSRTSNEVMTSLRNLVSKITGNWTKYKEMSKEEFYKDNFSKYMTDTEDISTFADGVKNLLRVGNVQGADREKLAGASLKSTVTGTMIPYILTQHTKTMGELDKLGRDADSLLNAIESEISKRESEVKESYLPELGILIENTVLAFESTIVMEDNSKDSDAKDRTKVKLTTDKDAMDERNEKHVQTVKRLDNLKAYNYTTTATQTVVAASVTIAEERYVFYTNLLKEVWKVGNTRGGRKGRTDKADVKDK